MNLETISFKNNRLLILDQTLLPGEEKYLELQNLDQVIEAIQKLRVRGAPAIGIVAAYGLCVHALRLEEKGDFSLRSLEKAAQRLKSARPTAVNLSWAVDRMLNRLKDDRVKSDAVSKLIEEAREIHESDRKTCKAIGEIGSVLLPEEGNILTHCNTGFLATGGIGTALGVIYSGFMSKKKIHVYVDETRPVGQGARLTLWELWKNKIPCTLITDNMAGYLMKAGKIDLVITGADRIATNGDTANKIGTYSLAVLASHHGIPFYIAAPTSTFDPEILAGEQIPIEERESDEVLQIWNLPSKDGYQALNPAFDVTPHSLITGIITEYGIIHKPFIQNIKMMFKHIKGANL